MKLTKQQKLLLGILGLGAAGLVVDKTMLSAPSEAQAVGSATQADSGSATRDAQPATAKGNAGASSEAETRVSGRSSGSDVALLQRMQALPEAADYERLAQLDAFRVPEDWLPKPPREPEPTARDTRVEDFVRSHRLTTVMSGPGGGFAVISGRTVHVGTAIDGFTLVHVGRRSATLRADDLEIVLRLPEPGGGR